MARPRGVSAPYRRRGSVSPYVPSRHSSAPAVVVDSVLMLGDGDEREPGAAESAEPAAPSAKPRPRLARVDGPLDPAELPPEVRLRREFKGLTVADLARADLAEQLPGQVRRALHHLQRGNFAAAEQALPGRFAPVLAGPGHRRHRRRFAVAVMTALAVVIAAALAALFR